MTNGHHAGHRPLIHVPVTRALLDVCEEAADIWMRKGWRSVLAPGVTRPYTFGDWLHAHAGQPQHDAMERLGADGDHDNATWPEVLDEVRRVAPALKLSPAQRRILTRAVNHEGDAGETVLDGQGERQSARILDETHHLGRVEHGWVYSVRIFRVNDAGRREHARQEAAR